MILQRLAISISGQSTICISLLLLCIVFYTSANWYQLFIIHPITMILAFVFCSSNAILVMQMKRQKEMQTVRKDISKWHYYFHSTTMFLSFLGIAAIFVNKLNHGKSHFTSYHSWLGMLTLALYYINFVHVSELFCYMDFH